MVEEYVLDCETFGVFVGETVLVAVGSGDGIGVGNRSG